MNYKISKRVWESIGKQAGWERSPYDEKSEECSDCHKMFYPDEMKDDLCRSCHLGLKGDIERDREKDERG